MGQYLKSYRVILTTKSPVYVGSGGKIQKKTICSEQKKEKNLFAQYENNVSCDAEKRNGTGI